MGLLKEESGGKISCYLLLGLVAMELLAVEILANENEEFPKDNEVFVLNKDNFDSFLEKYPTSLVEFYAPWCGHCKSLAPHWERAAKEMLSKTPYVPLGKVDATVETELASKYEVQGFPTIKFWKDGSPSDYDGPRDAEGIVGWISEKTDPNYKPPPEAVLTLTGENFKGIVNDAEIILVEFYAPWCGHCKQLASQYEAAAQKLKTHDPPILLAKVDATKETELAKEYQVTGYPTLKIFRKGRRFEYNGPREAEGIVEYMIEQSRPAAKELKSVAEAKRFMSTSDITILGFFATLDDRLFQSFSDAGTQYWREKILRVAKESKKYRFAISDEEEFQRELVDVGLGDSGAEINVVAFGADGKRYPADPDDFEEFNEETLTEFMEKLNTGHVKAYVKSAPLPKEDKGPVKTLVASNFDKIALDESKDVLVEFYAPWCGHCKQFEPVYKDLAKKFKPEKNMVIAKFDATANDVPTNFPVEGFPTIYFAPRGKKKEPIKYEGGRTLEDIEKFLKENAVVSFKKTEL